MDNIALLTGSFPISVPEMNGMRVEALGKGASSDVYLVKDKINSRECRVVAKMFSYEGDTRIVHCKKRCFRTECDLLRELEHPHIVNIICESEESSFATIFLDHYDRGDLYSNLLKIDNMYEMDVYASQLAGAISYLHSRQIVHRDIKPQNVLLKGQSAYLADFGHAEKLPRDSSSVTMIRGTAGFVPPEVTSDDITYDGKMADWYAYGVVVWTMLVQKIPIRNGLDLMKTYRQHFDLSPGRTTFHCRVHEKLIQVQTHPDPSKRRSYPSVINRLKKSVLECELPKFHQQGYLSRYRSSSFAALVQFFRHIGKTSWGSNDFLSIRDPFRNRGFPPMAPTYTAPKQMRGSFLHAMPVFVPYVMVVMPQVFARRL